MQHAEMCMTAGPVVFNYAQGLCLAACIFGFRIFESMRKHDPGAMLCARGRISDRLGTDVNNSSDRETSCALLLINLEFNRPEQRFVKGLCHRRGDVEDRREWLR